jgi:glycine betaine monooxygenase A
MYLCIFVIRRSGLRTLSRSIGNGGQDYNVDRLIHMWNATNLQDQRLVENNQRGVNGVGYVPGPYSPAGEPFVVRFVDWYCARASDFLARGQQ